MARLFSKPLSDTDISKRLAIPNDIFDHPGIPRVAGLSMDLRVRDSHGEVWSMKFTTRPHGYLKPDFRGDWRGFVQARGLQIGDFLNFYEDDEAEYRIEVLRNARLMGANITTVVA